MARIRDHERVDARALDLVRVADHRCFRDGFVLDEQGRIDVDVALAYSQDPPTLRRLLGLFAFFYIALHFATFAALDLQFAWSTIFEEIVLRPYLTLGMIALVAMIPLTITSTRGMQRRLGRKWTSLHRLVYPIGILSVWHYWWQVRGDTGEAKSTRDSKSGR